MRKLLELRTGGLVIHQSPQGHDRPEGLYFGPGGFTGWDDGAVMRGDTINRPQAHGDFDMPGFLAGRLMTIEGVAFAASPEKLEVLRERFIGHGAAGTRFKVTVDRNGSTRWAHARLASGQKPEFVDVGNGRRARWSTAWWFPDPRKYSENTGLTGSPFGPASSVQVYHRGNFPALPVLHITGTSAGGYTITGPAGRQIIVTRALAAGVPHRFDMATGHLHVGGARVLGGVARADLFSIPVGPTVTPMSISAGQLTVDVLDTFI